MSGFLSKIRKKYFQGKKEPGNRRAVSGITTPDTDIDSRIEHIYGHENIRLQKVYEKWTVRENWLIKTEGIPLILGYDPENINTGYPAQAADDLWSHAQKCVQKGLLQIDNVEKNPDLWTSSPFEIYKWATVSRIELPEMLNNLMSFIVSTIPSDRDNTGSNNLDNSRDNVQTDKPQVRNEAILGMALALLAACPDKCRDEHGSIRTEKIVKLIESKHEFWTGKDNLSFSSEEMADVLNRWLGTVNN